MSGTSDVLKVGQRWAMFDLAVTSVLAVRPLAPLLVSLLYGLDSSLGGGARAPSFEPIHWMFVNLAGILGVLWAVVRVFEPTRLLMVLDTIGRCVVALMLTFYLELAEPGAPRTLWFFVLTEVLGALHQTLALRRSRG